MHVRQGDKAVTAVSTGAPRWHMMLASLLAIAAYFGGACGDGNNTDAGLTDSDLEDGAGDTADTDESDSASDADTATDADSGGDTDDFYPADEFVTGAQALVLADPFFASGGDGFGYGGCTPAAQVPLGAARPGPDTTLRGAHGGFAHTSGYYAKDPHVRGFSQIRFVGTGVEDYGNFRILPTRAQPSLPPDGLWTAMDKGSEAASPGYYTVELPAESVRVELTATGWVAVHRYTALADGELSFVYDSASSIADRGVEFASTRTDEGRIVGHVVFGGSYTGRSGPFDAWSVAELSPAPGSIQLWDADGAVADSAEGLLSGALVTWDLDEGDTVEMRIGLSFVDEDQALLHLSEVAGQSFEAIRSLAETAWQEKLGLVQVAGGSDHTRAVFYSALYNVWRMPTRWDGSDGRYRGIDKAVHEVEPGEAYYTDLSLWDTYRTLHPLYEIIAPDVERDVLRSLLRMRDDGGRIPRWPAASSYTGGMVGSPADHLFAGGYLKGIEGVDYDAFVDSVRARMADPASAEHRRDDEELYDTYGYVPSDLAGASVSNTLEYVYADASLALLMEALNEDAAGALRERAEGWRNLLHGGFFMPRMADGTFDTSQGPRDVNMNGGPFVEGNAWHYRFFAPHAGDEMVDAIGTEEFEAALIEFFENSSVGGAPSLAPVFPDEYYWHGNEPDIHAALLFHHVDRYDLVQYWVTQIRNELYGTGPEGLAGNDDGGTLSAWYVFSALGLYPIAGSDRYYIGRPLFPAMRVQSGDEQLTISAPGAEHDDLQFGGATLNGTDVERSIRHANLRGNLTFTD